MLSKTLKKKSFISMPDSPPLLLFCSRLLLAKDLLACLRLITLWALVWMQQQQNVVSTGLNNVTFSCQLIPYSPSISKIITHSFNKITPINQSISLSTRAFYLVAAGCSDPLRRTPKDLVVFLGRERVKIEGMLTKLWILILAAYGSFTCMRSLNSPKSAR